MKRNITKTILSLVLTIVCGGIFTSCDDDGWIPVGPGWNDTFYDSKLRGSWQLVQANGRPVGGYDTNYLEFFGGGRGRYYYYENGVLYSEQMGYWCQYNGYGENNNIYISYEYGNPSTMTYWFSDYYNTLWLKWITNSGTVLYQYRYYENVP